ncbi:MAG: PIN domain-containing protein, partial [Deltaproteobacteria bacterium]|nr:PIN domain-containing protein [Deltaproteobacteria bacterium]
MKDRTFVDTNILVYAHDLDAGNKHEIARGIVLELWESRSGMLSTQVLQEFYMTLTRKIPTLLAKPTVRGIVKSYFNWDVVLNDARIILQASEIEETYRLSFWDALIVSAAFSRNAATILTEDLNHGQYVEGILIKNPFKA